ncbi:hypothetical protein METBIDRAFT_44233 [Metschnikowia bicuspidata var. bicuspidata NRRL YB-4993]|uniref:Anaphase-promoting complex subunit 4 n=1 Tax=Metschnikowia bicuspidata var. bicuspidata NRRL YB-4993 TaxID=869754 RepID=A0A1A0H8I5_9ASCO|nr:hypothetical protein METBIDRAFT_44233 [Metschnikowia bicuspidata var. bicuspidata NRRL YB-4993]OBA20193.1 hypothetical protein METBIDRAFT_44233 [Metschnikowia bicuspidata var. bicuspidata NRRL YB-4993]
MLSLPSQFEILASHKIVGFPDGNIISWCPQMDLLAVSMNHTSIWMFRLDGERVYSINNRAKILHLQWSHSGKFFVLSGTDHAIKVYDSNNGKLVNLFATCAEQNISLVSWASVNVSKSISPYDDSVPYQDLFRVEILNNMPKLGNEVDPANSPYTSSLVINTTDSDTFIDYLLVANGDQSVSVTFNNLLTVTGILVPNSTFSFLKHAIGEDFYRQSFLVRDSLSQLHLQDLHIDVSEPRNRSHFFDSIRYACQVISIMNHINEQFCAMQNEAKEFIALYDRYLANYKDLLYADVDVMTDFPLGDDIEEKVVLDLGAMLLTGLIPASTKDYWLNQFGERGLMRLSALGNAVYDNIRKVVFTQLILGLEKLIILLSYLEGLSKAADLMRDDDYGINLESVQKAITLAQDFIKKTYGFIWKLNDEHEYFNQYLNWLKVEIIEKLSKEDTDPESFFADHPALEFKSSLIMEYFSDYMFDSVLMQELDLDCSNHEILTKRDRPGQILKSQISDLLTQLKFMLAGMENFFRQKVVFEPAVPLDTPSDGKQSNLEMFGTNKLVTSADINALHVTKFAGTASNMNMIFPGRIVWHRLLDEENVLVLYEVNLASRKLDMIRFNIRPCTMSYDDLSVLKSLVFNSGTTVKVPSFVTINSVENPSNMMALILDESKKDYMLIRI